METSSPQFEHWAFHSRVPSSVRSGSSTPSKPPRQEQAPVELKQAFGLGIKRDSESLRHQQYLSDEENLSPIEHDDTLSVDDDSDEFDGIDFDEDLPELATTFEYTAKACTKALVISIKPVRPKMVDVSPSLLEKSFPSVKSLSRPFSPRDSPIEPVSKGEDNVRRSLSNAYSHTRRHSSVPLMESAAEARAVSAVFLPSPASSSQPAFLGTDPFSTSTAPRLQPAAHSRLRSLSKTISITKLGAKKSSDATKSPTTPTTNTREGAPRMKLVPRGANEREPILQLPEFPDELDDGSSITPSDGSGSRRNWPERTDSKERRPKLKKRKSLVFG